MALIPEGRKVKGRPGCSLCMTASSTGYQWATWTKHSDCDYPRRHRVETCDEHGRKIVNGGGRIDVTKKVLYRDGEVVKSDPRYYQVKDAPPESWENLL